MNSQEFARLALVLIYRHTSVEYPGFNVDDIVRGTGAPLPETFTTEDRSTEQNFVRALEMEAHTLPLSELRAAARLAQSLPAFKLAMQRHFDEGELPLEWALLFKKFKSEPTLLRLFQEQIKDLGTDKK